MNAALLPDDFHKLSEGEWALPWPASYADDQALLLKRLRPLALDQHLGKLAVVGYENTIVIPEVVIRDAIGCLESLQLATRSL